MSTCYFLQLDSDALVLIMDVVQYRIHVILLMVTVIFMLSVNQVWFVEEIIARGETVMIVVRVCDVSHTIWFVLGTTKYTRKYFDIDSL